MRPAHLPSALMPLLVALLTSSMTMPAWAVYRCEAAPGQAPTYSQWPCERGGQNIQIDDARSRAQAAQARRQHVQAERAAKRFDRRMRQEARQRLREQPTAIDGPVRQVSVGQTTKERKKRQASTSQTERPFKAVSPKKRDATP